MIRHQTIRNRRLSIVAAFSAVILGWPVSMAANASAVEGSSWVFQRSRFSHAPTTGKMVTQYAPKEPSYVPVDPTYRRSGYRHQRINWRGPSGSADRMHIVDTWGDGGSIRPYGEWQRPFRAGATPYGPWGNAQGPWTTPFESWSNPYGSWNRYPYYGSPYPMPGYGGGYQGGGYPPHQGGYPMPHAQTPHGQAPPAGQGPMPQGPMPHGQAPSGPHGQHVPAPHGSP